MWKWIGGGWEPLPGIPPHDYSDEEFEAICAEYDKQFPTQSGSLKRSKFWRHYKDKED